MLIPLSAGLIPSYPALSSLYREGCQVGSVALTDTTLLYSSLVLAGASAVHLSISPLQSVSGHLSCSLLISSSQYST